MNDLRQVIAEQVASRRVVDARERRSVDQFLAAYQDLPDPFSERAGKIHVTSSAIIVCDHSTAEHGSTSRHGVVLHKHLRLGIWLQPGGHIEPGEMPWQSALREATEETGLPVSYLTEQPPLLHVDVHPGPKKHTHLDLRYLMHAPPVEPAPPEGESQDVAWFPWHRAIATADAGLEGILRSLQPGEPKVRAARHTDAGEVAGVYRRSRQFGLPDVPVVHPDHEVRRWWADDVIGHHDVTVAEIDGVVAGLMVLSPGWIEQLYLDPAWMGRGLGDRLIAIAKQRQPTGLELWAFQSNGGARRFYERHGFVVAEFTDGHGNEERSPDVRFVWTA